MTPLVLAFPLLITPPPPPRFERPRAEPVRIELVVADGLTLKPTFRPAAGLSITWRMP